jgi:acyl-coenzyme A synthetase/AMP-(fatty) acid ligase
VIKITPTHLRALLAASDGVLPRLCLVLGGEALSWELVARIRRAGAECRVLNHYGPTETTVGCCTFEVPRDDGDSPASTAPTTDPRASAATVPIGRPLPGARAYILDRHLEPVPVGVAGELYIAGAGVARGYVQRPEESAERFVPEVEAGPGAAGRMYRTGDRARFLRNGAIEFLGRLDDQVKIRGFRVEPAEVEAALRRHPGVREAAVIACENEGEDRVLVAYVVGSAELPVAELQEFLGQSLPEHMVPSRFIPMDSLPLTPSGKLDRRALPDPASVESPRGANHVPPRDQVEEEIAAIWARLLGVEEVGVFDDFFALGGHSLLATQAIMRVRRMYGDIPLSAMFNSPTVAALADVVRAKRAVG